MNVTLAYRGHSGVHSEGAARVLTLEPNLARERVAFDAPLLRPIQFREAVSALHDVVINDLRYKPRDKSAYQAWKAQQAQEEIQIRRQAVQQARAEVLERAKIAVPRDLESRYRRALARYWAARRAYASYLLKHDKELWRRLMPYDPVITVADDVVFFECFSADESSYGCLTAEREATFGRSDAVEFGTTNVDYSWDLYNHLQGLRTYRQTRFRLDPAGFDVAIAGSAEYREEKIDLPPNWLRGFMRLQFAMNMPARKVSLSSGAVYSVLAFLRRRKPRKSPRAIRFELLDGRPPRLVLEPWEQPVVSHGSVYRGPEAEPVRIWGRQRLLVLARLLPLADGIDVYLLGTGFPSFWVVRMGAMRFTLGLSGWTANDWTRASTLDLLAAPQAPSDMHVTAAIEYLRARRAATLAEVQSQLQATPQLAAAVLRHLAHTGQAIYDLDVGLYRWRQILPMALAEADLASPNPELIAARDFVVQSRVTVDSREDAGERVLVRGRIDKKQIQLLLDRDGMIRRGVCDCSLHYRFGLKRGPCRHLFALRHVALQTLVDHTALVRR